MFRIELATPTPATNRILEYIYGPLFNKFFIILVKLW